MAFETQNIGENAMKATTFSNQLLGLESLGSQPFFNAASDRTLVQQGYLPDASNLLLALNSAQRSGKDLLASNPPESRQAASPEAMPPSRSEIESDAGVSYSFKEHVQNWWNSIPSYFRDLATNSGHTNLRLVKHASDAVGQKEADAEARHHHGEKLSSLPAFYAASLNSLIVVEDPDRQAYQKYNEAKGVKDYVSPYPPIERTGWHELGHALDLAALHGYTHTKEFDAAFTADLQKLSPKVIKQLDYFAAPDRSLSKDHWYDAAKQEVLAELFAIAHAPSYKDAGKKQLSEHDDLIKKSFPHVWQLLEGEKHHLLELH
jgi:hypothetical protein